MKPGRNDPCTCGSGKKYKKCCAITDDAARVAELTASRAAAAAAAAAEAADPEAKEKAQAAAAQRATAGRPLPNAAQKPKTPPRPGPAVVRKHAV